jgi:hypothetical protein
MSGVKPGHDGAGEIIAFEPLHFSAGADQVVIDAAQADGLRIVAPEPLQFARSLAIFLTYHASAFISR